MLNLILDSGAYTAWKSGKPISLAEYIGFIQANRSWLVNYIVMDHIAPGDPANSARQSWDNYCTMREAGLDPIPVFHIGEPLEYLDLMLRSVQTGTGYICLAGLGNPGFRHQWYDLCWSHLVDAHGRPVVRVHALGESRPDMLMRYPWASTDSSSWQIQAFRDARLRLDGNLIYMRRARPGHTRSRTERDVRNFEGDDQIEYARLLALTGIAPASMASDQHAYHLRAYLMARHYQELEAKVRAAQPITFRAGGLFSRAVVDLPPIAPGFNLHLVLSSHHSAYAISALAGVRNVLLSYAHLNKRQRQDPGAIQAFLTDPRGTVETVEQWAKPYNLLKEHIQC